MNKKWRTQKTLHLQKKNLKKKWSIKTIKDIKNARPTGTGTTKLLNFMQHYDIIDDINMKKGEISQIYS